MIGDWFGVSFSTALARLVKSIVNDAWIDFTPTLTQSGAVTITVDFARYKIIGKTACVQVHLTIGGAGTTANALVVGGIPAAIAPKQTGNYRLCGEGLYFRTGVTFYHCGVVPISTTTLKLITDAAGDFLGVAPSFAAAAGDTLALDLVYELA